jgi:hypothetical protein
MRAYVVRSERTSAGPRQRVVCYLGGIRQYLDRAGREKLIGPGLKQEFWERAMAVLDRVGIAGDDRTKVVAALEWVNPECHEQWVDEVRKEHTKGPPLEIGDRQFFWIRKLVQHRATQTKQAIRRRRG